ncbi:hypothetical protein Csa_006238 [Cucumis sativus]|uniref:Uncharacterized protein n=1 Tax=Cucumis sativus TaxID=3659 RepID=A0A0A0LJK5_CUCSA|nr:hypothetical protein Csa_006238 [Cucumis sativus]
MCMLVVCKDCSKYTWKGCGRHLPGLYKSVEKGKHCNCHPWPGVVVPPEDVPDTTKPSQPVQPSSVSTGKTVK